MSIPVRHARPVCLYLAIKDTRATACDTISPSFFPFTCIPKRDRIDSTIEDKLGIAGTIVLSWQYPELYHQSGACLWSGE